MFQRPAFQRPAFQSHRHAKYRISVGKVRGAIEGIDVPAEVAALIVESLLFAEDVVPRKLPADALADQSLGSAIRRRHQVGVALVLNLESLVEILHQERSGLASDGRHNGEKSLGICAVDDMYISKA